MSWVVDKDHKEASPPLFTELGGSGGGQAAFTNPAGYSLSPQLPSPKEEGADSVLVTHPRAILPSHPQAWPSPAYLLLYYRLMTSLPWRGREGSRLPFPSPARVCLLCGRSQPYLYGVGLEKRAAAFLKAEATGRQSSFSPVHKATPAPSWSQGNGTILSAIPSLERLNPSLRQRLGEVTCKCHSTSYRSGLVLLLSDLPSCRNHEAALHGFHVHSQCPPGLGSLHPARLWIVVQWQSVLWAGPKQLTH